MHTQSSMPIIPPDTAVTKGKTSWPDHDTDLLVNFLFDNSHRMIQPSGNFRKEVFHEAAVHINQHSFNNNKTLESCKTKWLRVCVISCLSSYLY